MESHPPGSQIFVYLKLGSRGQKNVIIWNDKKIVTAPWDRESGHSSLERGDCTKTYSGATVPQAKAEEAEQEEEADEKDQVRY